MTINRTVTVTLTPDELAAEFCGLVGADQAEFFDAIARITATWPGAGWCQQSYDIARFISRPGKDVVQTLAGHVVGCDL